MVVPAGMVRAGPGVQGILHAGIRAAREFTKQYNGLDVTGVLAR